MAFTEAQLQAVMAEEFDLARHKAQFSRGGDTSRWFTRQSSKFKGREYHFYAFSIPSTGTRGMTYTQARDNPYPEASQPTTVELMYEHDDVTFFKNTVEYNEIDQSQTEDAATVVFNLANRLVQDALDDTDDTHNMAIHLDTSGTLGTIVQNYKENGDTYATANTAFWQLARADINRFQPGLVMKLSGKAQAVVTVVVNDVIYGKDGPNRATISLVQDIGPGIVVSLVAGSSSETDLDFGVTDVTLHRSEAATGDGEANTNFNGFDSWMSGSVDVYKDRTGSDIDRDAIGNAWSIPTLINFESGGNPVALDIDVHFRELARIIPSRMRAGRKKRQGLGTITDAKKALNLPEALVLVGPVDLIEAAAEQIGDTQRFTSNTASSMDAATRTQLFGQTGFDGTVIHTPTLPPIALQADKHARPNKLLMVDPQSWQWLKLPGGEMKWVKQAGSIWHVKTDATTGRLTETKQGGYKTNALLFSDQIGTNFEMQGLKSDLD